MAWLSSVKSQTTRRPERCKEAKRILSREEKYSKFLLSLKQELERLYDSDLGDEETLRLRDIIYGELLSSFYPACCS